MNIKKVESEQIEVLIKTREACDNNNLSLLKDLEKQSINNIKIIKKYYDGNSI